MSRFILGDSVQVMSRFPARAVDFILTDPPYLVVSVAFIPSFIFVRVSYHGHFREHGHYRGQKYALQQKTLDLHCAEPSV